MSWSQPFSSFIGKLFAIFFLVFLFVVCAVPSQAALPTEFERTTLISDLNQPTSFRFLPDGRIFISEKEGAIKVVQDGVLASEPLVTMVVLATDAADERGLLGIEVDPDFANNGYLYVSYTTAMNRDRLSRLTVTGNTADINSELVLLESNQDGGIFHHGGDARFGPDGKLYWALGENTFHPNSQMLNNVHGKLHRLNSDGSIPADNPFVGNPNALPSIWAYGLRNPFRFDFLPNGKPIVGDVGGALWEEVNIIERGANYGWPLAEGTCLTCGFANPLFTYAHTPPPESSGSITSALWFSSPLFPAQYSPAFFYADYTRGFIRYLKLDETQTSVLADEQLDGEAGAVVQLSQGPDGNLYQMNFYPGELYKIALSDGNRAPVAQASVAPPAGNAPLAVTFSSAGSNDPDGSPLTYAWDFGDGTTSTEPNPSHVYTTNGTYEVTLTVHDGVKSGQTSVTVTVGNNLPQPTITSPTANSHYNAGDTITFTGVASDMEDGSLPDSAFTWTFRFHHGTHTHPFYQTLNGTKTGTFVIPRDADNLSNTWYAITLTVTDSGGLQKSTTTYIYPNLVTLTINSSHPDLQYTVDGVPVTGTFTEQAVVGVNRVLAAVSPQFLAGQQYRFVSWSDGGAASHSIETPAQNATYTINYAPQSDVPAPWQTDLVGILSSGNSYFNDGLFSITSSSEDIWDTFDGFYSIHQALPGDGEIIARVTSQTPTSDWAKAGIMVKQSMEPFAPYVLLSVTPEHGYRMQYNFTGETAGGGAPYTFPNAWMKLQRTGDLLIGSISPDGVQWTETGRVTVALGSEARIGLFMTSHDSGVTGTATFDNVQVNLASEAQPVPAPWQSVDVGQPAQAGSATHDAQTDIFTLHGGGRDIWQSMDEFQYTYQTLTGNGEITARVLSQTATDDWAKAGVMIKSGVQSLNPYALLAVTPVHGLQFQHHFTQSVAGGNVSPLTWIKLRRQGSTITAFRSENGTDWTEVGSTSLTLPETLTFGLFVTAHNAAALSTATFDDVSVTSLPSVPLPSPWQRGDVGNPSLSGDATYDPANGGTFTVSGAGHDIWETNDQFYFVSQELVGDGTLVARITSQTVTSDWAKAGLMIKESDNAFAPYVLLAVTPEHGVRQQRGFTQDVGGQAFTFPLWLKLERAGQNITTSVSSDRVNWTVVGTSTFSGSAAARIGLFVTSHNGDAVSTATFDSVTLLPNGWQNSDVGSPALAGSANFANGVFTVNGAGNDIWDGTDQFHWVYRQFTGDGEVIARVRTQGNTHEWAKAGVMIKESLAPLSPYAFMAVTPGHGYQFQWTFERQAISMGSYTFPNAWVKLKRVGNLFTSSYSADGVNWTVVGVKTVPMNTSVLAGLFVTSHNGEALSPVQFDQVTMP